MLNKTLIILIGLFVLLSGCKRTQKFDRAKWDEGDGLSFPYRKVMVDDLVKNHKLKGLKYQQVIHLLDRPQFTRADSMRYSVEERANAGKTVYTKILVLYLKDSIVTGVAIREKIPKQ